ncbi:MAG: DUF664 domain-containing protein [Actinomycetales bacterium]|jgi:hypothetical protein|nr:DUF664 domain-containing protein [Actinomycetales bacterium]HMT33308.1 DUF664 domain-containing protein [Dermatophilaceae bacterium]
MGFLTPNAFGEHAILKTFALQQLAQLRTTVHGLTTEQARLAPTASSLTLAALVMHGGAVAVGWSASAAGAPGTPVLPEDLRTDPTFDSLLADGRSLPEVLAFFDRCVEVTTANIDAVGDLDVLVPVPDAPWYPADLTHWQARWCLAHISTEVARHTGHADIIRETIDGKTSFELNDLAEQADR